MNESLKRTPLHALHLELGAKMVPFAGYEMPVQYPLGILKEHLHTRSQAGLFDVSHMGQLRLAGDGADVALERLVSADIVGLQSGRQRYALFTNAAGGILDDLMVTRLDDELALVVNAACKDADIAYMREQIGNDCALRVADELALLALQGPAAVEVLTGLNPAVSKLRFMQAEPVELVGHWCLVSRSGYTGEDGFEISAPAEAAETLARGLLAHEQVMPIGLGARDSLRLEAGLCLYGHDLNERTTLIQANLRWAIGPARRPGGDRAGGYHGADVVAAEMNAGAGRLRVGLQPEGRAPVREGAPITNADGGALGTVTSGGFGPSAGRPVAMGYVRADMAAEGTELFAEVRGKQLPMRVQRLPFVAHQYAR